MNIQEMGKTIKARRQALGIDQKSLSEISGVAVHTISNIEQGKANPTVEILNRLAEALGMELRMKV